MENKTIYLISLNCYEPTLGINDKKILTQCGFFTDFELANSKKNELNKQYTNENTRFCVEFVDLSKYKI